MNKRQKKKFEKKKRDVLLNYLLTNAYKYKIRDSISQEKFNNLIEAMKNYEVERYDVLVSDKIFNQCRDLEIPSNCTFHKAINLKENEAIGIPRSKLNLVGFLK